VVVVNPIRNRVAVVGTAFSPVARHQDKTVGQLAIEAAEAAVADAGLSFDDIDGIANYPSPSRAIAGNEDGVDICSLNYLVSTIPLRNVVWSCSITQGTVTASLTDAVHAVAAGACTHALVYRAMYNPPARFGFTSMRRAPGNMQFSAPYGMGSVMGFAFTFNRYLGKYGGSREKFATFMVNNRHNASLNPEAVFYNKPISRQEYLEARMIAEPLSMLDCDMPVTGVGALVVTSAERARDLPVTPAYVSGCASIGLGYGHAPVIALEDFQASARILAHTVLERAGVGPADIDQPNLYDGFAYFVPLWLEAFGFCGEGEALDFIQNGTIEVGGKLPLNTAGGALGMGRLHGTPQLIEAVRQLQGRCGPRQVDNANITLAQSGSPVSGAGAVILTKNP
jgi:acetyl-CoA acetyltransferase